MTTGKNNYDVHLTRRKDKKLKKLLDHHDYLNRKTKELDEERGKGDRTSESKVLLKKLKITKLAMKDEIARVTEELEKLTTQK
jgi:uncharacterized protein YdcH (DUF465 family)|tara:strand:+ start:623 stop:871 length:249 start_codon:yes stop_codon:yes gene_type:complete